MNYFSNAGWLYGVSYTISRSLYRVRNIVSTYIHRKSVKSCGSNSVFQRNVYVKYPRNVVIESGCFVGRNSRLTSEIENASLFVDENSQISQDCRIDYTGNLLIGKNVTISANSNLYTHDHGLDPRSPPKANTLEIEDGVWIGQGSYIMPKVKRIGKGAIIGAGSIVTRDVPPFAIVAGNPAIVIRSINKTVSQI